MEKISACTLDCQDSCSTRVRIHEETGRVTITGNPDHPFTRGLICHKGRRAHQQNSSDRRITTPLIRHGHTFHPADWNIALDRVAAELNTLRANPATILHVRHFGYRGVLSGASRYLFNALGASSTRGALCDDAGCQAFMEDFGALEMNDPMALVNADHIVNWGKDLSRSSIHLARIVRRARKKGISVTTVSPGGDGNGAFSDEMIRVRPGRDRFLAAAVIKTMVEEGLADPVAMARASNLSDFMAILAAQDLETLLAACDCTQSDVRRLVSIFTRPGKTALRDTGCHVDNRPHLRARTPHPGNGSNRQHVALVMGWGLQRYRFGGETTRYLNALSFLAGQVGRSGGGTYFNIPSNRNFNDQWVSSPGKPARYLLLPRIGKEILAADPPVLFLLADGSNFVNQSPDAATTAAAMEKIPFKVVVDAFMTDTAARADVILPCALAHEREEIVGSCLHNWVNRAAPVFPPRGAARCDFDIISDLARRLDIPFPDRTAILKKSLDTKPLQHVTDPLAVLKKKGTIKAHHPRTAWKALAFAHLDGKYRLPESLSGPGESPPDFPMNLLSLVNRDYMHSQIPESVHQEQENAPPTVWANPSSCYLAHVDRHRPIDLVTPLGRMAVQVRSAADLHPRALIIRRGGWLKHGRSANHLIAPAITDIGETAAYYSQRARLENGSLSTQSHNFQSRLAAKGSDLAPFIS